MNISVKFVSFYPEWLHRYDILEMCSFLAHTVQGDWPRMPKGILAPVKSGKWDRGACSGRLRWFQRQLTAASILEMWANAQRDGRPAEYRWRPLFNAAKFG